MRWGYLEGAFEATGEEAPEGPHDGHEQGDDESVAQEGVHRHTLPSPQQQSEGRPHLQLSLHEHRVALTLVRDVVRRLVELEQHNTKQNNTNALLH